MCRLLGFKAKSTKLLEKPLYYMLRASRYDPLIPGSPGGHEHGWGIALYTDNSVFYYRSSNPLYIEPKIIDLITSMGVEGYGIAHIRRAGSNEPLGLTHTHPYMAQINDTLVFLAHNGGLLKNNLAKILGYKGDLDKVTDTFLYFKLLIKYINNRIGEDLTDIVLGVVEELVTKGLVKVRNAKGRIVDSTLNSLIMFVSNNSARILVLEDWEHIEDSKRREYYAIKYSKYSDIVLAASNTIYKWLLMEKFKPWKPRLLVERYVDNHKIKISEL